MAKNSKYVTDDEADGNTNGKIKADWREVDVSTLKPKTKKLYEVLKAKNAEAREAREAFNKAFLIDLGDHVSCDAASQHIAVGHNFGKLSFAVLEGREKTRGDNKKFSFG